MKYALFPRASGLGVDATIRSVVRPNAVLKLVLPAVCWSTGFARRWTPHRFSWTRGADAAATTRAARIAIATGVAAQPAATLAVTDRRDVTIPNIPVGRGTLHVRAERLNLLTHANVGQLGHAAGTPSFGRITGTHVATGESQSPRRVHLAAKFSF
jgi:hypothetical protein